MNNIFRLSLLSVIALISVYSKAETVSSSLIVTLVDGSQQSVALNNQPVIRIIGEKLNIKSYAIEIDFDLNKVKDFTYGSTNYISSINTDAGYTRKEEDLIFFSEINELKILITSINGIVVKSAIVPNNQHFILHLGDLPSGVYIVTVNGVSSEIIKR